jgi:hypothetical protein
LAPKPASASITAADRLFGWFEARRRVRSPARASTSSRVPKAHQHYAHDEPMHDIIDTSGAFSYFHGGRYVTGTWRKAGITALFTFTCKNGEPPCSR